MSCRAALSLLLKKISCARSINQQHALAVFVLSFEKTTRDISRAMAQTQMENMFGTAFDVTGATKHIGSFIEIRAKLIVVGIVAALIMLAGMIVTATTASKVKKVMRDGGCKNEKDLEKAYKWAWASALTYGLMMTLFGGISIVLIVSMFL